MTERHLRDTLLSADLQASTSHHPTTATIYTDPPTTRAFLTHQPDALHGPISHTPARVTPSQLDALHHHNTCRRPTTSPHCPRPHSPDVLVYQHTSLQTLSTTPQHPTSLDQHDPRSPTRAQHSSIPARFPRLPRTLSHGPHCDSHTRPNQLPLRHAYVDHHCHATTNRHNSSSSTPPPPGPIPLPRTPPSYHTLTSEPHHTPPTTSYQYYPSCWRPPRAPPPSTLDGFYHSNG